MLKYKNFYLNGKKYHTSDKLNLSQLMKYFSFNTSLLVLEYNFLICPRKNWNTIYINDNDCIEVVTIVGGG